MRKILITLFFAAFAAFPFAALPATLLPNAEQGFVDANGQPLAFGSVQFYVPGTTTPKATWYNSAQTALNANPVILDGSGRAIIYGTGVYRQVVKDALGTQIWDQITADTSANNYSYAGDSGGTANAQTLSAATFTTSDGQQIGFIASFNNTGALTFAINGQTPINVVKDTPAGPVALTGGEVIALDQYQLVYDATLGAFHLLTYPTVPGIGAPFPVVSAATTDLGTASTHDAAVSGTAVITSFGASASITAPFYLIQFTGTPTITASTVIITPSGANISASAGDSALLVYQGAGIWRIISYSSSAVPSTAVMAFNAASCPAGWTASDGTHSTADLRGFFVRGLDTGGTIDPSRVLGTLQQDQVGPHTHLQTVGAGAISYSGGAASNGASTGATSTGQPNTGNIGTETRPKNVALLYCQKL